LSRLLRGFAPAGDDQAEQQDHCSEDAPATGSAMVDVHGEEILVADTGAEVVHG
jgi:hypothetical protein